MNNPFDQFDNQANPFDQFDEGDSTKKKERSGVEMLGGALETGASMLAGMPAQIWGGLSGIGSLMIGEGPEKAAERLQAVQEHNFGAGQYTPSSEAGQEYTEKAQNILNYPVEKAGDVGGWIGKKLGNEAMGRYYGELPVATAMEMIEPTAIFAGAKGLARRGVKANKPSAAPILEDIPEKLPEKVVPEQMNLFDQFDERSPISPYQTEMAPDMWRVDENGIPIRADLSMEAQNLQNPLQRNLWGDEVDVNFPRDPNRPLGPLEQGDIPGMERFSEPQRFRNDPEGQRPLTEAIDSMPPEARTQALAQTQMGRELPATPEMEVAKMDAEISQWLQENKKPVSIAKKGRVKKQSGAAWFGDLGESKKLQDLVETLPYRFQALEKLPNKEEFTVQQLQQSINRQEVSEAERTILQRAYNQVTTEGRTKANAKEFVDALNILASDYALNARKSQSYADFGLDSIGRISENGFDIQPYVARMTQDELQNMLHNGIVPDWIPMPKGTEAITNIWQTPGELSGAVTNHFRDPNYFGHTRNFKENGQRYVVEIQSDLVQRYKKAGSEALSKYNDVELSELQSRTLGFKEKIETAIDTDNLDAIFKDSDESYLQYITKLFNDVGGDTRDTAVIALQKFEKTLQRIDREIELRATRPQIDTMSKNWFQRLIREELADAAKKNESTVRFATADTMAKVGGWPSKLELLEEDVKHYKRMLAVQEKEFSFKTPESPFYNEFKEEIEFTKNQLQASIKALEEAKAFGRRFDPNLQGIYDRYNKDVTKYLNSIGGQLVMDDKGHSWIEVPVEKHRQRPIMFGQRGALLIDWTTQNKVENSSLKNLDGTFIPNNPDVSKAIEAAKKDGKDSKIWTYTQSGSTSASMKSGSPIIKAASEIVQNAVKRADLMIRNFVFPAERSLRKLSKKELVDLGNIMKEEMFTNQRVSGEQLLQRLSVKQLEAYRNMRDLFDKTLDSQNAARVAMGKEPITAKEAYLSSRWQGDFRQPVYNQDGKLVWYLAAESKLGLERQAARLQKTIPGLVVDPKKAHITRSVRSGTDLQSAYSTMIDILGRDDPAIQKIQAAIQDQMATESSRTLAQEKHFEKKSNIRGFAGDRPWMERSKDTLDMFQQQLQYAKNAFKWSELQTVGKDIKAIVSDATLQETQPNNIKYIREYFKNAMGLGEAEVTRAVNDALRKGLGVSPHVIDKAIGNVKSFFILQKLAVSAGYTISNMIQAGNVMPYLADLAGKGVRGNPLTAIPTGFLGGMAMGTSHYLKSIGGEYIDKLPTPFLKDAFRYAEDNGVTARSVYDESPLESSFSNIAKAGNLAAKTMTIPETFVRSVAFMTYAQWLKDSGKFPDQSKLFQKAEELTNMSMVDYRETERPMMFAKAGAAGNFLNTLQTYPFSFYNQWAYMLGEAFKGNVAGLAAIAAFQFAVAGAMGIPGFEDADKLYKWMRDNALPTGMWNTVMKNEFFSDPKMWMIDNLGQGSVYGALSDQTGLGMTSRVAAPGAGAMLQSPVGPIVDIAKQVGSVASAAMDPTNTTKVAQAAMKVAPVGLQGLLEQAPFMEGITYVTREDGKKLFMKNSDLADRKGGYVRTPEEQAVRNWGIRSQQEVLNRDVMWATNSANQALTQKGSELIDQLYDAARRGDQKKVKNLTELYVDITGKEIGNTSFENQLKEEFYSDIEKNIDKSNTPRQLLNAARMQKLLKPK